MIKAIKYWLLIYGMIDFTLNMYFQMPMFAEIAGKEHSSIEAARHLDHETSESVEDVHSIFRHIGLRKVWTI
jgi:hypothetical protein